MGNSVGIHSGSRIATCSCCKNLLDLLMGAAVQRFAIILAILAQPGVSAAESAGSWKLIRGDISEYRLLAAVRANTNIDCLSSSEAAIADAASFNAASGVCLTLVCDRGGAAGCRKCRHAGDPSLPVLWVRVASTTCWRTFQHRVDGSVVFNRTWSEYASGFGQNESLNYWIRLERLHNLTATGVWRVRWEFSDWNGTWYWAENSPFSVGPASDKYRASMGPPDPTRSNIGQPTEPNWIPNNQQFSTMDADNDLSGTMSCASLWTAGWWYGNCASLNPNGVYRTPPGAFSMVGLYWYLPGGGVKFSQTYSMKTFECLIRQ